MPVCPECGSTRTWKDGLRYVQGMAIQRYLCRNCGYRFSEDTALGAKAGSNPTQRAGIGSNPMSREDFAYLGHICSLIGVVITVAVDFLIAKSASQTRRRKIWSEQKQKWMLCEWAHRTPKEKSLNTMVSEETGLQEVNNRIYGAAIKVFNQIGRKPQRSRACEEAHCKRQLEGQLQGSFNFCIQ